MSDTLIKIPEYILHETIDLGLKFIRDNYAESTDKDESYLRKVLKNVSFQRYNYIEQAEAVFLTDIDNPRHLICDLMYNQDRDGAPTIYITLPGEQLQQNGNGLGLDEGYEDPIIIESTDVVQGSQTSVFTRRYQAVYLMIVNSDNSNEVTLIYHVIKALLLSLHTHMALRGLENVIVGGKDIAIESSNRLFNKAISISLQYETSAPNLFAVPLFKGLIVEGKPVNNL